jgi:nucleotide-binding universal stress UspA family protein
MKTILVPIDFSGVSREVMQCALRLARGLEARVVLLHVVLPPVIVTDAGPLVDESLQFTARAERGARRHLLRLQQALGKSGVKVDAVCVQGFAVPHILAQARELGARYIVLGSHGHTAFYDLVVGGTAHGVLQRAGCPVVVVPAQPAATVARK